MMAPFAAAKTWAIPPLPLSLQFLLARTKQYNTVLQRTTPDSNPPPPLAFSHSLALRIPKNYCCSLSPSFGTLKKTYLVGARSDGSYSMQGGKLFFNNYNF